MDTQRIKQLIAKREEIDRELVELVTGNATEKKAVTCSTCNQPGHTARTCKSHLKLIPSELPPHPNGHDQ